MIQNLSRRNPTAEADPREGPRPSPLYSDQTLETAPFPPPPIMSRSGPRTERYLKIMII